MNTNEVLEVLRANCFQQRGFAGTVVIPRITLEIAIAEITRLAFKTDPAPLAKALGDLQRQYAAAVGDFQTIQGSLQARIGELVRERDRLREDRDRLHRELEELRPPAPKFNVGQILMGRLTSEDIRWHPIKVKDLRRSFGNPNLAAQSGTEIWWYQSQYSNIWYREELLRFQFAGEKA